MSAVSPVYEAIHRDLIQKNVSVFDVSKCIKIQLDTPYAADTSKIPNRRSPNDPRMEVAPWLALHNLSEYATAFNASGWDSITDLRDIGEQDLTDLITASKMKPGHVARLRKVLLNLPGAAQEPCGGGYASENVSKVLPLETPALAVLVNGSSQPLHADLPTTVPQQKSIAQVREDFISKLFAVGVLGVRKNGTICDVYKGPNEGEATIQILDETGFWCGCCPLPNDGRKSGNGCSMLAKRATAVV